MRPHYSTLATMGGYDVVDERGRPVASRETRASANGVAYVLNRAAALGSDDLCAALGAGRRPRPVTSKEAS
jgi:hypothetical protein